MIPATLKLYLDSADLAVIREYAVRPEISGVTTNPTLARKAGVTDFLGFCREAAKVAGLKPISFEVFADDPAGMIRQARVLAAVAPNVYVKIPVSDTEGRPTTEVVRTLSHDGVKLNVTAVFTHTQAYDISAALAGGAPSILSMFAGRIADAGVDPVPHVAACVSMAREFDPNIEVLWASPREILNVVHAGQAGCAIITLTPDLLKKLSNFGKPLKQNSLETVRMLTGDAVASGFTL
jgi:transaldolase